MDIIFVKLQTVLPVSDLNRILIRQDFSGRVLLVVDVHGMHRFEARRFLSNLVNLINDDFDLDVIHGFNHGTILRDMIWNNFCNPHISGIQVDADNPGITHLKLAA